MKPHATTPMILFISKILPTPRVPPDLPHYSLHDRTGRWRKRLFPRICVSAHTHGGGRGARANLAERAGIRHVNRGPWKFYRLGYLSHEPRAHPRAGAHFVDRLLLLSQACHERVGPLRRRRHLISLVQRQGGRYQLGPGRSENNGPGKQGGNGWWGEVSSRSRQGSAVLAAVQDASRRLHRCRKRHPGQRLRAALRRSAGRERRNGRLRSNKGMDGQAVVISEFL